MLPVLLGGFGLGVVSRPVQFELEAQGLDILHISLGARNHRAPHTSHGQCLVAPVAFTDIVVLFDRLGSTNNKTFFKQPVAAIGVALYV